MKLMKSFLSNCKIVSLILQNKILLLTLSAFATSVAQTGTSFPPIDRCTSKDLELVSATLTGGDVCNSCTQGTTLSRALTLGINNKTGSTRTAFSFWGTLEITHQNGSVTTVPINRCSGPIPPTGPLPAEYKGGNFGAISYQCGDSLRLINLYLAWTDASPGSTCASINSATINPKCGTLPAILINAGVNGRLAVSEPSCTALGSIAVSPFGGRAPYTVTLGSITRTNVTTTTTFTNLAPLVCNISVTDANSCVASISRTLVLTGSIDTPTASVIQPTCTVASGIVSITSPVNGVTYTLNQSGILKYTANSSGIFSSVVPGTYALNATNGTCSASGDNKVVNPQPQTPTAPTVCVIQPSLCGPVTGSVTIITPTGSGYEYSIDNGASWQTGTVFSNLSAGSVTGIKAKREGCISTASNCDNSNCTANRITVDEVVAPAEIKSDKQNVNFNAYPVPFKDLLTIRYQFDYKTEVKIEIFNPQGTVIFTKLDSKSYINKEITLDLNIKIDKEQMYIVKLTTNRGSSVKKIISSRL